MSELTKRLLERQAKAENITAKVSPWPLEAVNILIFAFAEPSEKTQTAIECICRLANKFGAKCGVITGYVLEFETVQRLAQEEACNLVIFTGIENELVLDIQNHQNTSSDRKLCFNSVTFATLSCGVPKMIEPTGITIDFALARPTNFDDEKRLENIIEEGLMACVLPGFGVKVIQTEQTYAKYMLPKLEQTPVLTSLVDAIKVQDSPCNSMLRCSEEGRPLWHVIHNQDKSAWILGLNAKYHPPSEVWSFKPNVKYKTLSLSKTFHYVAWWVHPDFITPDWHEKLDDFANNPKYRGSNALKQKFDRKIYDEVSGNVKKPDEYLNTIEDVKMKNHVAAVQNVLSKARDWFQAESGCKRGDIEDSVHFPVGSAYSTLHVHFRLNGRDNLAGHSKAFRLKNPNNGYGHNSGRARKVSDALSQPTGKKFREYRLWAMKPSYRNLTSCGAPFIKYNSDLGFVGLPTDVAAAFESEVFPNVTAEIKRTGVVVVIVGNSGSGKDTLIANCRKQAFNDPEIVFPVRIESRPKRPNIEYPENLHWCTKKKFLEMEKNKEFIFNFSHPIFKNVYYGYGKDIFSDLFLGKVVVLNLGRWALEEVKKRAEHYGFHMAVVEIVVEGKDLLKSRMISRNRDDEKEIKRRLAQMDSNWPITKSQSHHAFQIYNDNTIQHALRCLMAALACCQQMTRHKLVHVNEDPESVMGGPIRSHLETALATTPPQLLVLGHLSFNLVNSNTNYSLGGAATYASIVAASQGVRTRVITSLPRQSELSPAQLELLTPLKQFHPILDMKLLESATATSQKFFYDQVTGERTIFLLDRASVIEEHDLSERDRRAEATFIAPVIGEVPVEILNCLYSDIIVVGLQGWLRQTDAEGRIIPSDFLVRRIPKGRVTALTFSKYDHPKATELAIALTERSKYVIVTRGRAGLTLYSEGKAVKDFPPLPGVEEVDPDGAGDTFGACLTLSLRNGNTIEDSIQRAAIAGALKVTKPGFDYFTN